MESLYNYGIILRISLVSELILKHISQKTLCNLSSTCKVMKDLAYNPGYWVEIELPFQGVSVKTKTYEYALQHKLFSTLAPPSDYMALHKLFENMIPRRNRFINTTIVKFKNFMFDDSSLLMASELFPSLERIDVDGGRLTAEGLVHLQKFTKLKFLSTNCNVAESKWMTIELETQLSRYISCYEPDFKILKKCNNCNFYFNPDFNSPSSCLFHPEMYYGFGRGNGHYKCCGSMVPGYSGSPGCSGYTHHIEGKVRYGGELWLPEFYDVPFPDIKHLCFCIDRRPANYNRL